MVTRKRTGFTIVELLVVIAIISMLMALLVPAVQLGMSRARQASCLNNTMQLGKALHQQATVKGYFPGRLSLMMDNGGDPMVDRNGREGVTWVMQILPNLEQQVLQDFLRQAGTIQPADTSAMYVSILECPSDAAAASNVPALSYAVNSGIPDRIVDEKTPPDSKANGVFHDLRFPITRSALQVGLDSIVDGASTTIMLSENVDAGYWNSLEESDHGFVWIGETDPRARIINVDTGLRPPNDSSDYGFARPSSNHSGGVNVAFCGTNARYLRDDIDYRVYVQLMTPDGRRSVVDLSTTPPTPAPDVFTQYLLSAQDHE